MSPIIAAFLRSAALPAALLGVVNLLAGFAPEVLRGRIQAIFFAAAYAFGSYMLLDRFQVPPHDFSDSIALAGFVLAGFVLVAPRRLGWRYVLRSIFTLAVLTLTLWHLRESMDSMIARRNVLAFFFLGLGVWSIVERAEKAVAAVTLIALPLVSATGLSFLLLLKGSASMSQQVSILCSLSGAMAVLALVLKNRLAVEALVPFLSVFVMAFMAGGHFYLDVNPWHMVVLCFPYLVLWIRPLLFFAPKAPLGEALVLGLFAAAPLGYFLFQIFKTSGPLY